MYCFTRWKRSHRGATPDLPSGSSFQVLAEPGRDSEWCLVSLSAARRTLPKRAEPVHPTLGRLLESGRSFPPAIALACAELRRRGNPSWGPSEMSDFLVRVLRRNLRQQSTSGYVLAEVRRAEIGYSVVGEFVWILGARRERPSGARVVIWVSTDFCIYENAATDFRIPKTVRSTAIHNRGVAG
jgi:hypothetical protein